MSKKTTQKKEGKAKGFDMMAAAKQLVNPALVVVGLVAGKFIGDFGDKALKVSRTNGVATTTDSTEIGIKGHIVPVAEIVVGGIGMAMSKDSKVQMLAAGFAANGIYKEASLLAKKDILNGLAGDEQTMAENNQYFLPENYEYPALLTEASPEFVQTQQINGNIPSFNS